ncbi:MAG: hypothetical protein CME65_07835 [Halobacteriovoraceae bacterium]|nr:hypothetical protein [Halobacteriovoraceae bacterium]|tara:strand:+ start:429 stop:1217 length:789 start_codon:yes stop_codon:yes gene_type:complete
MPKLGFILICLIKTTQVFAYRLNTSNGASFGNSKIKFYVTSNSTCNNAGVDQNELLSITKEAVKKYWNTVSTSEIELKSGGIFQTSDSLFLTGELCPEQDGSTCGANNVPYVSKLLIACNSESSVNFPSDDFIAISAPTRLAGSRIRGSVILINDTATSPFANLSRAERVSVMAHEIGHAVGLGHSNKTEALMYFENADKITRLSQDDRDGISYLYPVSVDNCNGIFGGTSESGPGPFLPHFFTGLMLGFFFWRRNKRILKS